MSELTFPNETAEYREARDQLLKAEIDLRAQVERVAAMRRALPSGGMLKEEYAFDELTSAGVRQVKLAELFEGSKNSLFLYNFMYGPKMANPCPMCSSIIDGLNASARHISLRVNLAVVARSPIERIKEFAKARGWNHIRLLSSSKNTYNADYFGETAEGDQFPMANVFTRRDGSIYHFWGTEMLYSKGDGEPRHMDMMGPIWNIFDATPDGRGDNWHPPLNVISES
jgi:predicted dithiol-disulfide oxidoreductase (DUF899 family)